MAVTIASVRARWGVSSANVDDDTLTLMLADATTQIQGQQALFSVHYEMALTALAAHYAYRYQQVISSGDGSGREVNSESFVDKSFTYGDSASSSNDDATSDYLLTGPGRFYLGLIRQRGRRVSPFTT